MSATDMKVVLATLAEGRDLAPEAAAAAFAALMDGTATPAQTGAFLMGLRVKGESVAEITAGARALRERMTRVKASEDAIDTCGTGGDAKGTFNISTAASLVAAACGARIAKHGNRALSSRSGGAQVLEALGVRIDLPPERISACIEGAGIGFMMAPLHHSAMKHVAAPRQEIGTRTVFNLLGPLSNPAGVRAQVMGVFAARWVEPIAHVLRDLGTRRAMVVHGSDGIDELTVTGPSLVAELVDGVVRAREVTPEEAGLGRHDFADLVGGGPAENAAKITALLAGERGAYHDIVCLNAAAALVVAGRARDLRAGAGLAAGAIASGAARETLARLIRLSTAD
ncbi:MAG: anthranilate phosphoribosyltransferase [Alphaproteobacteria bacterium]|nr:anthranilate phosphoribosyltransferase [Alphaproteobacteria bacterium]